MEVFNLKVPVGVFNPRVPVVESSLKVPVGVFILKVLVDFSLRSSLRALVDSSPLVVLTPNQLVGSSPQASGHNLPVVSSLSLPGGFRTVVFSPN